MENLNHDIECLFVYVPDIRVMQLSVKRGDVSGTINPKDGISYCLTYLLICIHVKKHHIQGQCCMYWLNILMYFINRRTEFKVKEDALSQTNHPPHWREKKSHGANIREKTDYSATIRFWH